MKLAIRRLSLRGLRTFCLVARHRSFRVAAEELFLTASAVSHQVRSLEQELEVTVFARLPRGLALTEAGESLFAEVDPLIRQLDEATSRFQARFRRKSVRVSVQPFFATELFVPRLSGFTSQHAELAIHVDASDPTSARHYANADISIRLFRSAPTGLLADRLFRLRLVAACSPEFHAAYPWAEGQSFSGFPLIVQSQRPQMWQQWSRYAGIELGEPSSLVQLDTMTAVAGAAERGIGAALVPLPLAEGWFRSGKLVRLAEAELLARDCYYSVLRAEDAEREEVSVLREWIKQEFSSLR